MHVKAPSLDIWRGVDCPGTCETESYMEKLDTSLIMAIIHVPLVELLC
jgi:hypothetical protein